MVQSGRRSTATMLRVARHRRKAAARGNKRVEVTVPARDAALVRALAAALRRGGDPAQMLRKQLRPLARSATGFTGDDLVAFFRMSPLVGVEIDLERDKSSGRPVVL